MSDYFSKPLLIPGWDLHSLASDTALFMALIKTGLHTELPVTIIARKGRVRVKLGKKTIIDARGGKAMRAEFELAIKDFHPAKPEGSGR